MTAHPSVTVAGTLGEIPTNVAAPSARNRIFAEIDAERARQDARWGEQNHPMVNIPQAEPGCLFAPRVAGELECRRLGLPSADEARDACNLEHRAGHGTYASIAVEELAEAVEAAVIYGDTSDEARKELVQTAAVLVAMIECLDQKRAAVVGRVDGRPLVDLDRKRLPAILRAALDTSTEGGPARDALVHTDDGRVAWSPEAAPVVAKVAAARKKVVKKAAKR